MSSPTAPVAIPRRHSRSQGGGSITSSSPPISLSRSPAQSLPGSSPPASRSGSCGQSGAKRWLKRLQYDPLLDSELFTVGFVETRQQAERKSGAEAWSLRQHSHLVELPFAAFLERFGDGEDMPLHRIAFFKQAGISVWESDAFKAKLHEPVDSRHGSHHSSFLAGTSPPNSSPGFSALAARMAQLHQQQYQQQPLSASPGPSGRSFGGLPPTPPLPPSAYINFTHSCTPSEDGGSPKAPCDDVQWSPDDADVAAGEVPAVPDYTALPDECWRGVLGLLGVHELCTSSCVSEWLRRMVAQEDVWQGQYSALFGEGAPAEWNAATLRRMCRRSELRAARWLEAEAHEITCGFTSTACLQIDDTKVVSGDGSAVRLWSHATGRRIATLPGHTGRVVSVAFDEELIVSGCTQGALKVWAMDELKCTKTLRTQHGSVAACALMHGVPVSAGDDGNITLWDVGPGTPIVSLDAGHPVTALDVHAYKGFLVSVGHTVDVWDLNAASKLYTLSSSDDEHGLVHPHDSGASRSFTCVSHSGNLVAAGKWGQVLLWDARCQEAIGTLHAPAAALGPCVGVQLDDWKLVTGFALEDGTGEHALGVYDIRAAASQQSGAWQQPVKELPAQSRVTAFQFLNQSLLVGQEGAECLLWSFEPPGSSGRSLRASSHGGVAHDAVCEGACSSGGDRDKSSRKKKDKPVKANKKQGRFPKRGTR